MSDTSNNNFTMTVRHRLVDLQLSVTGLAKLIGRPRSTVSKAITGNKFPKVRRRIARRLGIKLSPP
jgi:plasmid maintenance system antidote protein VapI